MMRLHNTVKNHEDLCLVRIKLRKLSLQFQIFTCFRFKFGSFSHQNTVFASLRNEAKQTFFFAISLQAKIRGHPKTE
jgi:hypothetical protein